MYMYYTFDIIPHQGTFINNIIWRGMGFHIFDRVTPKYIRKEEYFIANL